MKTLRDKLVSLIETIRDNMTKCNVGTVYGHMYETGYRAGVEDVLVMFEELLENEK